MENKWKILSVKVESGILVLKNESFTTGFVTKWDCDIYFFQYGQQQ